MIQHIMVICLFICATMNSALSMSRWQISDEVTLVYGDVACHWNEGVLWEGKMRKKDAETPVMIFQMTVEEGENHPIVKRFSQIEECMGENRNMPFVNFLGFKFNPTQGSGQRVINELALLFAYESYLTLSEFAQSCTANNLSALKALGEKKILTNFLQLAKAMELLHKHEPALIMGHFDWDNILLDSNELDAPWKWWLFRNTPSWSQNDWLLRGEAPEILESMSDSKECAFTKESDVYAFSTLMGVVLAFGDDGGEKFRIDQNPLNFIKMVPEGFRPFTDLRRQVNPQLRELLEDGWHALPAARPTMTQFVQRLETIIDTL